MPDARATGGLYMAVPIIVAAVVTIGLGVGWNKLFGYTAHARETHERSIAFGFGVALFLIGAGCSGWFLASLIGGNAALRDYELDYVQRLNAAADTASKNVADEADIVSAWNVAATNLSTAGTSECSDGGPSGKRGKGVVCIGLRDLATGMASVSAGLVKQQQDREDALARSRESLEDARRDIAAYDAAKFQEDAARAATEVHAAAKAHLSLSGLNMGITVPADAQPAINQATTAMTTMMSDINSHRRVVEVPDYQPVDTKKAMLTNPQPLAWLAAIVVETLPLIGLGLLLVMWRDEEDSERFEAAQGVERDPRLGSITLTRSTRTSTMRGAR
jgi:hypothetical protein